MNDPTQDVRITAYLFGELTPDEHRDFEKELAASEILRGEVEATRRTIAWLEGALPEAMSETLSPTQRAAIVAYHEAMLPTVSPREAYEKPPTVRRRRYGLECAVFGLVIAVGWILWTGPMTGRMAQRRETTPRAEELANHTSNHTEKTVPSPVAPAGEQKIDAMPEPSPTTDDPVLAVTPQIIIQEEEEESLVAQPAPPATELPSLTDALAEGEPNSHTTPLAAKQGEANRAYSTPNEDLQFTQGSLDGKSAAFGSFDANPPSRSSAALPTLDAFNSAAAKPVDGSSLAINPSAVPSEASPGQVAGDAFSMDGRAAGGMGGYGGGTGNRAKYEMHPGAGVVLQKHADSRFAMNMDVAPADALSQRRRLSASELFTSGDQFSAIVENPFLTADQSPLSTFSIDVDTASYSKVRMVLEQRQLPRPDMVRLEELINYFPYDYAPPEDKTPFAAHLAVATCPWNTEHRLVRIGLKGREVQVDKRPASNLVFLVDVSGSMDGENRLPLVVRGLRMLVERLTENDRVAIVVYAGNAGMVLDSTTGDQKATIVAALDRLRAGGSTNGGEGIHLAYRLALDHRIPGGVNRVVLCTDGDFNVGTTGTDALVELVQTHARQNVFLTVLGFGMGNHNDAMLEQIADKGNGNYAFVDSEVEAHKVLVQQLAGTLVTIAKDVKIQIEFNPAQVARYRLLGYENRIMAHQDFHNDAKDAGEIGAGHTVTALYEIVPALGTAGNVAAADRPLKYQPQPTVAPASHPGELLTMEIRYKEPEATESQLLSFTLPDKPVSIETADVDFRFAAAVAGFGMLLRQSPHRGSATFEGVLELAAGATGSDVSGYRAQFLPLVRAAAALVRQAGSVR